ncbi:hypothetical protein F5X99DRAFT_426526 [Biscogniauxia marginata]|nr:hypothetical protein F5X99DRAFT_426526 [Biscogniauxia marginata]
MDTLPNEVFDNILSELSRSDKTMLLRCNKSFHQRIEPLLYDSELAKNEAMYYACRFANLEALRLAVSYGAPVSVVKKRGEMRYYWSRRLRGIIVITKHVRVLTLHLAAKSHDLATFKTLLELGAQVDDASVRLKQVKTFMRCLSRRDCWALFRFFLQAGRGSQIAQRSKELSIALITLVRSEAPLELLALLLDNEADPNHVQRGARSMVLSPLSAAILNNSTAQFNFLLERGACIHGTDLPMPSNTTMHIPVFAAARMLAQKGPDMIRLCLANGANINHCTAIKWKRGIGTYAFNLPGGPKYHNFTPLLTFLYSIIDWGKCELVARLAYLFENGALARIPDEATYEIEGGFRHYGAYMMSNLLLRLENDIIPATHEFFTSIHMLLQRGAERPSLQILQDSYKWSSWDDGHMKTYNWMKITRILKWKECLALMMEGPREQGQHPSMKSNLLRDIVIHTGAESSSIPEITTGTIECLLGAGADINRVGTGNHTSSLHKLCFIYNWRARMAMSSYYSTKDRNCAFFRWLLDLGSDPMIEFEHENAIDYLKKDIDDISEEGKDYLLSLASVLETGGGISSDKLKDFVA